MDAAEAAVAGSPNVVDIAVAAAAAVEEMVEQTPPPKVTGEHEDVDRAEDVAEGSKTHEDPKSIGGQEPNVEGGNPGDDDGKDRPSKESHLNFGTSLVFERSFESYKKKGYLIEPRRCRAGGSDTTPDPREGEIVLFECFFNAGLRLPMRDFVPLVLQRYEIFFHQLTPNAFARLSAFYWALGSQSLSLSVEAFVQSHELHYQTKKDPDIGLHPNFGCYSFRTRSGSVGPCTAYRSKWSNGWNQKWFYYRVGKSFQESYKSVLMKPLAAKFGLTKSKLRTSEMTENYL